MDVLLAPYQYGTKTAGGVDSTRWMCPIKLFEYMSTGIPVICSDLPVLRERITNGLNGLLVKEEDVDAWVSALTKLKDTNLRKELGGNARQLIEDKHTWEKRAFTVLEGMNETK
jgi:glycosyltransferase involved in cell wall biosynthesis